VEQGKMILTSKWEPEGIPAQFQKQGYSNYTAVCVSSIQKVMYGYFEIRCKAAPICMTSSFWFQGKNSEIDVFEIIGKAKLINNTETRMPTNIHSGFKDGWDKDKAEPFDYDVGNKVAENFNVFGLEWDPTNLVFYSNGKVVRSIENKGRFTEPQTMFFDMETFKWHGYPEPSELPGDFEIDYIRTWTRAF
jgi:beta-glucanase (GH16 family)